MDKEFWEARWKTGKTGWDLGEVSPPLKEFIDQIDDKSTKILIPGAGNAYEAKYLLDKGFKNITVVDISESLIEKLKSEFEDDAINLLNLDFFDLNGQFDLILEQTFFCALEPTKRPQYVDKMASLLMSTGLLTGVLFDCEFEGGPPFGGSEEEYKALFKNTFDIIKMEPCYNSVLPRSGNELWIKMSPKKK